MLGTAARPIATVTRPKQQITSRAGVTNLPGWYPHPGQTHGRRTFGPHEHSPGANTPRGLVTRTASGQPQASKVTTTAHRQRWTIGTL